MASGRRTACRATVLPGFVTALVTMRVATVLPGEKESANDKGLFIFGLAATLPAVVILGTGLAVFLYPWGTAGGQIALSMRYRPRSRGLGK